MADISSQPLLSVENLHIRFKTGSGYIYAVNGVSFTVESSSVLGIVGESGCGKSVTAFALLGLLPENAEVAEGRVIYQGRNVLALPQAQRASYRGKEIALISQDPLTGFNPVYSIGDQIREAVLAHNRCPKPEAEKKAVALMKQVGIPDSENRYKNYPHEFSGGMRQRAMIAMALANEPKLLLADEPTTALDVTIQAQVLDLLSRLQKDQKMGMILITHDLGVVAQMCDQVLVMYAGQVVEQAPVEELFENPQHPYTVGLLDSLPRPGLKRLSPIPGQPPRLTEKISGCSFRPRCPLAQEICATMPDLLEASVVGHSARCHFRGERKRQALV
jgi:oligopeptide/dipeptide ABC transporter ATP-binding protein